MDDPKEFDALLKGLEDLLAMTGTWRLCEQRGYNLYQSFPDPGNDFRPLDTYSLFSVWLSKN